LVKVETLQRVDNPSDYIRVLGMLDAYKKEFSWGANDQLWCLIDRDNWPIGNIAQAFKRCKQKKL
jgi:hypothetical protein